MSRRLQVVCLKIKGHAIITELTTLFYIHICVHLAFYILVQVIEEDLHATISLWILSITISMKVLVTPLLIAINITSIYIGLLAHNCCHSPKPLPSLLILTHQHNKNCRHTSLVISSHLLYHLMISCLCQHMPTKACHQYHQHYFHLWIIISLLSNFS